MNTQARDYLSKARAGLILDHPFFGSLALRLQPVEDSNHETLWTDGRALGYNPEYLLALPLDRLKGVIAHEVLHCALQHMSRRGERDPRQWNEAGDYAINNTLTGSGFALPDGALIDPQFKDMGAEEIYAARQRKPDPNGQQGGQGGGQGQQQQQVQDPNSKNDSNQDGSGSGNGCGDVGGCGEVRDAPAPDGGQGSPADQTQLAEEWKVATTQAATQAKAMGKLPGDLKRLVEEALEPKANWREILRRFMDCHAKDDYSWTRPNRRFAHAGLILPSAYSESMPPVVLAIDTSGSVSADDLAQFAGELTAILEDLGPECTVIYCDTQVAHTEVYTPEDLPLQLEPHGGGGTDFRPPFQWIEEQGLDPACMIYLTDLCCSSYPAEPSYPVLWATDAPRKSYYTDRVPFGEVIHLD